MNILLVNKYLFPNGGSETYVFRLGEHLKAQGHEVQYFGMEHEDRCVGNDVNVYTSKMDFHGGAKISKVIYPIKTIYSGEARKKIRLVLNDFQPDVVHLNNFSYQLTPSIILEIVKWRKETGKNCRIVFTAHDYNLICPNHMLHNPNTQENCEKCIGGHFLYCTQGKCIHGSTAKSMVGSLEGYYWKIRKTYRFIDSVICCSEFMKSKMDTNTLFKGKTIVLHNFIDKVEWKDAKKKDYVLYFGRYSEEKGINTLIDVCKELPDIVFIFAGTGPLEEKLSEIQNIKNIGFQTGNALWQLIREARFSVYPSEWYENCPFSVMESQMFGTPVLGADIGGIPELIIDGKTGELFQSGNKDELKRKIDYLWNNKAIVEEYTNNCKEIKFDDLEKYYQKLMRIYNSKKMNKVVLSDGDLEEMTPFMIGINNQDDDYRLDIHKANWIRSGRVSEIRRYIKYFSVSFNYFIHRKEYDEIVGWQQFYALIFSFYCSLFHVRKSSMVTALNYTYKEKNGKLSKIYKCFMKKCMDPNYLDFIHIPSIENAVTISNEFGFPSERIITTAFGVQDDYQKYYNLECPQGVEKNKYFLSIGRSNRDYDFLIRSWDEGLEYKLVIISDTYKGKSTNPNVVIIRDVAGEEQYPWIINARGIVLTIDNPLVCSGDTVLLKSMSFKKIVIVSEPSSLAEMYIADKENGLVIKKNKEALRNVIYDVISGKYDYIQEEARKDFLDNYSREKMGKVIVEEIKTRRR